LWIRRADSSGALTLPGRRRSNRKREGRRQTAVLWIDQLRDAGVRSTKISFTGILASNMNG